MLDRFRELLGFKPQLRYLELHITDHCNLNCRGCGHFAPIAEEWFANLNSYKRDLKELKTLFSSIRHIVLLGGEPLLNPEVEAFMFATKAAFPKAEVLLYTNGILLPKMPEKFWNACRSCSVAIDITIYPPVKKHESVLAQLVKDNGLKLITHSVTSFHAFYNKKGDTEETTAFKRCRERWYNPMLREGKIYVCPKPATLFYFNKKYGLNLPTTESVDIYTSGLNGWEIIRRLDEPSPSCRYCTLGWETIPIFPWSKSNLVLQDWDALANQV